MNDLLGESIRQADGTYERVYPQGSLAAHAVGYTSQRFGSTGVENTMGSTLVGEEHFETIGDAIRAYAGEKPQGNDVVLTINSKIQRTAEGVLYGQKGACVVLDTATGAVLAEASTPTYDNNNVESILTGSSLSSEGTLVNRATQTLYAPGSTFKIVTLGAALDTNTVTPDTVYSAPSSLDIGNAPITNYKNHAYGRVTVAEATALSANTAFAQIADELGAKNLVTYAEKFGFNSDTVALDFNLATSLMPDPNEMTRWETAWAGDGQPVGEHESPAGPQATVMEMAVCMAAISNNGVALHPYVVSKVVSASGSTTFETRPQIMGQTISEKTAKTEQEILAGVVDSGTGTQARVDGANVIGKTGTAETGKEKSDAWFVGTAQANGRSVTVAIVIEEGDSGGDVAAPKASTVFLAALRELGAL